MTYGTSFSENKTPEYKIKPNNFSESSPDQHQITLEDSIVGYNFGYLDEKIKSPSITLSGISRKDKYICIRVENRNGTYLAKANIRNPNLGATVRFKIPSKKRSLYKTTADNLAVISKASPNKDCKDDYNYLATSWNNRPSDKLYILVNLEDVESASVALEGIKDIGDCLPVDFVLNNDNRVFRSFNQICVLNLDSCQDEAILSLVSLSNNKPQKRSVKLKRVCP